MVIVKIDRLTISRSLEREKKDNVIKTSIINLNVLYQVYMIHQTITIAVKHLTQIPQIQTYQERFICFLKGKHPVIILCHSILCRENAIDMVSRTPLALRLQ